MHTHTDPAVLRDLHLAIARLAAAVDDEPPMAAALRRFAEALPACPEASAPDALPEAAVTPALYRALDEGALDARRFDWLMLARSRARSRRQRRSPRRLARCA